MLSPNDHVLDYVDAYLHEMLSPADAKIVEEHSAGCPICQVALEEARKRFEAMQALPALEASEELIRATQRRIEAAPRRAVRPATVGWSLLATAALVIACFHVYYLTLSPSAYDLRVLGQTQWLADSPASLRVLVVNRKTNQPMEGVPVDIELAGDGHFIRLASFETDQFGSGTPRLRLPDWASGEYKLSVRARTGATPEIVTHTVKLRRSWQLMVTSDKPVYQPGQVIHVRSLGLRRPDLKPIAGQQVVFSVTDPKGNVILRKRDVTSRFGIAAIDCPLATEIIEGLYQVQCQVGDTTSSVSVEVKKYVLPKFRIELELDRPYYQPGERVRGTVRARYFFGKPVEKAEVKVEVRGVDIGPTAIAAASARTDSQGEAAIEFPLPASLVGRPQESGDARIALKVTVRDPAGQEEAKTVSRVVTAQPIRIEVIPEAGVLVPGIENTVYILTSYPDGRPAPARVAVSGFERELSTNSLGATSLILTPGRDPVAWTIRASDSEGHVGRREIKLEPGQVGQDFLVRTDKAVYDGGQTMHILALGGGNQPVFLDLIKDGQTLLTDVIELAKGRGEYQFDLPPELFGTIELFAYRYSSEGVPVVQGRVIYVRQAGGLRIAAQPEKAEYRPGERAKIGFTVTDEHGKPAPGALSLAAVDEAVFSVLGQLPGMQKAFFTLEQELLKPVYAIYPWSPDLASSVPAAQRDSFEQALFAKTAEGRAKRSELIEKTIDKFAEGDRRLLKVFERPDWEQLAESMQLPPHVMDVLRSQRSYHSLADSTYPTKVHQLSDFQRAGLGRVKTAWIALGVIGVLGLLVFLLRNLANVLVVIAIIGMLIGLLLPAGHSAREASRRASAINDLKQLEIVIDNSAAMSVQELPTSAAPEPRLRQWFPETLLWRPELITDDNGRASIEVDLADSITTWQLSASAVSADGKLGGSQTPIRVFQPFFVDLNLPVALTRGDEVAVPAVVYNYLDRPQTVRLKLADADWFERLDNPKQAEAAEKLELAPGEVRSISYRLRARKVGRHELKLEARGGAADGNGNGGVADAIQRSVEVVPDGRRVEQLTNGTLAQPAEIEYTVPPDRIEGSAKAIVKIYPSSFSQLVEGLDAIFQRPYGCFEQTSSTTYPNILALDYLRRTKKSAPEVEAKARQYIHLGYQRLVSFEVAGGGFDWFGRPAANRALTAYGLMEFTDMARVHDVDPRLIERTRQWLLSQQEPDGSWAPAGHGLFHDDPTRGAEELARLSTTAYIAWAVFADQPSGDMLALRTRNYLAAHAAARIDDPYVLALMANALLAIDPSGGAARPYVEKLDTTKRVAGDAQLAWWEQGLRGRTMFYGAGRSGSVETTALAALAMIRSGCCPETARRSLAWLVMQKDASGTWHSTQATVLALKALLAGTGKPLGGEKDRRISITLDGKEVRELTIPAAEADVMQQVDLSALMAGGRHRLSLLDRSGAASGYQVEFRHYVPGGEKVQTKEPLGIEIAYDKTELHVNDAVTSTATVVNQMAEPAPMVILDLPIPAGFAIEAEDLAKLAASEAIAKYQVTPRSAIVYLRQLEPGTPLRLQYRLRATMPVRVSVGPARAYEYYDPDKCVASAAARLTVTLAE